MTTTQIRQQLHNYIDNAGDKKLKAIYTLLEDNIDVELDYKLSKEQKAELDQRFYELENGIGKNYNWDEIIAITEQAIADRKK